jgi:hypothetical protein
LVGASILFYAVLFTRYFPGESAFEKPVEAQITPGHAPTGLDNLGTIVPSTPIVDGVPIETGDSAEYIDL